MISLIPSLAGRVVASVVVLGVIGGLALKLRAADAEVEQARAEARANAAEWANEIEKARLSSERSAEQVRRLTAELRRRDSLRRELESDLAALRAESRERREALREATRDAPTEYTDCMGVRVPERIARILRGDAPGAAASAAGGDRRDPGGVPAPRP